MLSQDRLSGQSDAISDFIADAAHAVVVTDGSGNAVCANQAARNLFPQLAEPAEKIANLPELLSSVAAGDHAAEFGVLRDAVEKKRAAQVSFDSADNITLRVTTYPAFCDNAVLRLWEFCDVSDQRRLEHHQAFANRMNAITRFAGGLAHEFNNLLTTVLGNLELVRSHPETTAALTEHVEAAESAALRIGGLIHQLRRYSTRHSNVAKAQPVAPLLRQLHRILTAMAAANLHADLQLPPDADTICANFNENDLMEVLLKVATNALDAIANENGEIRISLHSDSANGPPAPGTLIQIRIADSGPGMSKSDQERVFDPYFTTKRPAESVGMGMAVAQNLIENIDGRIHIESTEGVGTAVVIELPRVRCTEACEENLRPAAPQNRSMKIAVVEHDGGIRNVAQGMLTHLGHAVEVYASGAEFLHAFQNKPQSFELILLDDSMPGLSGRQTFSEIRRRNTDVAVVICSGRPVSTASFGDGSVIPPLDFLSKPFTLADLEKVLTHF